MKIEPIAGALGAEIGGIDLADDLGDERIAAIRRALLDHLVIFFRDQHLTPAQFLAFARRFGALAEYPFVTGLADYPEIIEVAKLENERVNFGGIWHSDTTYLDEPPMGTLLTRRELRAQAPGQVPDTETLEGRGDALPQLPDPVELAEHVEELPYPQLLRQGQVAGGEADLAHRLAPLFREGVASDAHPAGVGEDGAQHHQQGRGLAGAVRAKEAEALAGLHGEVQAIDGDHVGVCLSQAAHTQGGFGTL